MADKAKHAHGLSTNVDAAIAKGTIDAYDVLFLDADTDNPKIGWVSKSGKKVVIDTENVIVVGGESLPDTGVTGKVYIFNDQAYIWNDTEFKNLCKPTDLTELTNQITELETQMGNKVDETTVENMIKEYSESVVEIVEF